MSHAFDTGLDLPVRSLIRAAVLALLAPKLRPSSYLAAIVPFPRVIADRHDEDGIDHAMEVLGGRAPAVLVAVGDARFTSTSTTPYRYQGEHDVQVVALSNSGRGLVDRLTLDAVAEGDDTADPGIDVMLNHVGDLLTGRNLDAGAGIQPPRLVSVTHLETDKKLTLWAINFTVSAPASVRPTREQLERLTLIVTELDATATAGGATVHTVTEETPIP